MKESTATLFSTSKGTQMIRKFWLLLALLVVLLMVQRPAPVQPAESPQLVNGTGEDGLPQWAKEDLVQPENNWVLIVTTPGGDPVGVSRWRFRDTCEMERASMVGRALRNGATIPGTRCMALSWLIWFRYLLGIESGRLEEYLEEASNRATLKDLARVFAGVNSRKSPLVRKLLTGQTMWTYESGWKTLVSPPEVSCYILTFDGDKILRAWRHEWRQGDCSGPLLPEQMPPIPVKLRD